jgi:hypothetical protein
MTIDEAIDQLKWHKMQYGGHVPIYGAGKYPTDDGFPITLIEVVAAGEGYSSHLYSHSLRYWEGEPLRVVFLP